MKVFLQCLFVFLFSGLIFPQDGNAPRRVQDSPAGSLPLTKVRFQPHWNPQAQFAGYYVGLEQGIYKKYGIDLTIVPGGPRNPVTESIEKGKADFVSMWITNAVQLWNKNFKVVNITQLVNKSALMLVAKKSKGILKPQDMEGKKVGIWGGDYSIQPKAFFEKLGIHVRFINQPNSINLFLMDGVDVSSVMWYNEYYTVLMSGLNEDELSTFRFEDYGLNFPEDGIYCTEEYLKNNPQVCKNFVSATLEGWQYAFDHVDETVELMVRIVKEASLPVNRVHQKWMLLRMQDLILPGEVKTFQTLPESDYNVVIKLLQDYKIISKAPLFHEIYRPILGGGN